MKYTCHTSATISMFVAISMKNTYDNISCVLHTFFFIYLVSENTFLTFKDLKSLLGEDWCDYSGCDGIPTLNCSLSDRFGKSMSATGFGSI